MEKIRRIDRYESIDVQDRISEIQRSTFDHFIPLFIKQALRSSGEVFISEDCGELKGLYVFDPVEQSGTCFTGSTKTAKNFYSMGLGSDFFSEILFREGAKIEKINYLNMSSYKPHLSIKNEIKILGISRETDIIKFLRRAYSKVNEDWVKAALEMGEKCFACEVDNRIVGMGWISSFLKVARLHSLYVEPGYRHISIGKDLLISRLYYAVQWGMNAVTSEIPEQSIYSQKIATDQGFKIEGILYNYRRS